MEEESSRLGITQEYNKENRERLWDSAQGKSEFKNKKFNDQQTYRDPISGEILHKSQNAAQNKYHMRDKDGNVISTKWAQHSAEVDHIVALKDIHDRVKGNPFLSDADLKEIANSPENYRILSKSYNTSKGETSDWDVILNSANNVPLKGKMQIAREKISADIALQQKFAVRTVKNAGKEFISGGTELLEASVIPLTSVAIENMMQVARGEATLPEAARSMGNVAVDLAVVGGGKRIIEDSVRFQLQNNKIGSAQIINNFLNSNQVGQIITVAALVKDTAIDYLNGKINDEEFTCQVIQKGTVLTVGMLGGEVGKTIGGLVGAGAGGVGAVPGAVIGEILGSMITTVACGTIVSAYQTVKETSRHLYDFKIKEKAIKKLEEDALNEISRQREHFKSVIEREMTHWDEEIQQGFDMMLYGACKETFNIEQVTEGLDRILAVFGKSVAFRSLEEYEKQLDQPLKLCF